MCKNSNSFIVLMSGSKIFLQQVLALLAKDLKTEWRTREIFTSMFVFAVLVVVVFNFAIGADTELIRQVASGVVWVALLFATVLGLQRAGQMESEEDSLQGVLLALHDRSALFIAKMLAQMLYLLVVVLCTLPLCGIWFRIDFIACIGELGIVFMLGNTGFKYYRYLVCDDCLAYACTRGDAAHIISSCISAFNNCSVYATAQLIAGITLRDIADYLSLIGVFDIVFFTLALIYLIIL